jgi:hypothetical protein
MTDYTDADDLRTDLETLADDRGEIDGDRPTLTVTYETRQGNERTRTGDVWRVSDGGTFDDAVIRFSANAGDADEDPYYIRVRNGEMTLISISERGSETDLGAVVSAAADIQTPDPVTDGGEDSIRTTIADAALAGVTDDPDVTAAVADCEPGATLAACRTPGPLLDFDEYLGVSGVDA